MTICVAKKQAAIKTKLQRRPSFGSIKIQSDLLQKIALKSQHKIKPPAMAASMKSIGYNPSNIRFANAAAASSLNERLIGS